MDCIRSSIALGCVLGLIALFTAPQATACSVCLAGDPLFTAQGTSAQEVGSFSAYFEVRGWTKRSAALEHGREEPPDHHGDDLQPHPDFEPLHAEDHHGSAEERADSTRADLYLSWTPLDRLTLTLDIPYAFNHLMEIEGDERDKFALTGIGDIGLQASGVLWRNRAVLPSTWIEGRALIELPTGESERQEDGVRDPHLQAGSGSWDFGFGLAGVHRRDWATFFASVFYRVNTEGSLDYEYGDITLANLGVEIPLGHVLRRPEFDFLTPGLELNFRHAELDEQRGESYEHSGGSIPYLTPTLRIRLPGFEGALAPSLRGSVQIPLTSSWLNGEQEENEVWSVGLHVPF